MGLLRSNSPMNGIQMALSCWQEWEELTRALRAYRSRATPGNHASCSRWNILSRVCERLTTKHRFAARFFLTYLCVWLPLLLIGIIQTHHTRNNLIVKEEAAVSSQLLSICNELDDLYLSYQSNSIALARTPELLPYKMLGDYIDAYYGIRYLKSVMMYDLYAYETIMYYGQGKIYASFGYAGLETYLTKTLQIRNADAIVAVFESENNRVQCAWRDAASGFVVLHFPVRDGASNILISANYCIPFSSYRRLLNRLSDTQPVYINLAFPNGEVVHYDGRNGLALVSHEDYAMAMRASKYTILQRTSRAMGVSVEIVSDPKQIYSDVNNVQYINNLLMMVGVGASMLASVYLSRNRSRKIRNIEALAGVNPTGFSAKGTGLLLPDEYAHIQSIIQLTQQESSDLRSSQRIHQTLLKQQTLQLMFHSFFKSRSDVNQVLGIAGIELFEEHYFVGGVLLPESSVIPEMLWARFALELCCAESLNAQPVFFYLLELPNTDLTNSLRAGVLEEIQTLLKQSGVEAACLGVSQAYQDIYEASYAYQEVMGLLERAEIASGFETKFWEYPSEVPRKALQLDKHALEGFLTSVEERDAEAAASALHGLNQQILAGSDSDESKRYLRYTILQPMIELIQTKLPDVSGALVEGLLRIDPSDGASFEEQINRLLSQHLVIHTRQDNFQRVLDYIRANYADCNLTAEKVAEYGGFNKAYLSRLFKTRTQLTYIDYLTHVRMNKAKELLRDTDASIREIVNLVGYIDDSSFRRKFKLLYGISAMDYRNRRNEDEL